MKLGLYEERDSELDSSRAASLHSSVGGSESGKQNLFDSPCRRRVLGAALESAEGHPDHAENSTAE